MGKVLDMNKTLYELAHTYDDFLDIMTEVGFAHIKEHIDASPRPKQTTIAQAAQAHGIDLDEIRQRFEAAGYTVAE